MADRRLIEAAFPPQVSLPPLLPRKERAARAHLDAAHLAGAAAVGGEPGGVAGDAAAGSGPPGRAPQAAGADGGAGGGSVERQWGADEGEDPGRDLPLRARGRWEACEVSGRRSGRCSGGGRRGCWTRSRAAGRFRWEAMRLGWEAMVADINPVAWFILRCTLHYPRLLAGEARPLPSFALRDRALAAPFRGRMVGNRCLAASRSA